MKRDEPNRNIPIWNEDEAVRSTNDEAAVCKLSAVSLGYYKDEFIKYFVHTDSWRKDPLMNRGYYSRVAAIWKLITRFIAACAPSLVQIVQLGAGYDTTFFRLKAESHQIHAYFEVDFEQITRSKISSIKKHEAVSSDVSRSVLGTAEQISTDGVNFHSPTYHIIASDLRNLAAMDKSLVAAGLHKELPTLFISECVLIYLEPEQGTSVIEWAAREFQCSAFITYEQIHPFDSFGAMMLKNLETRGCSLRSIKAFPDAASQQKRYSSAGWTTVQVRDMNKIYNGFLDRQEIIRISRLEFLDELEEWTIIQSHYCIVWATQDKTGQFLERWKTPAQLLSRCLDLQNAGFD